MNSITPISYDNHKSSYIKPAAGYDHVSNIHILPVYFAEFLQLSGNMPIVFVKDAATGKFKSVALMGLEENQNVIFGSNYANSNYVPINIRRYPFSMLVGEEHTDNFNIAIDADCDWVNDKGDGYPLFKDSGEPSAELSQIAEFLKVALKQEETTNEFIEFLTCNDLLQAADLSVNLGSKGTKKLSGVYQISQEQIDKLSDKTVLELHKRKYNSAIYSHIASMHQFQKLVNLTARKAQKD